MEQRYTPFGDWLRARRDEHDLTQIQLAEMIGTANHSTISHWENYGETPNTDSLLALAAVFGAEPHDLYDLLGLLPPSDIPAPSLPGEKPNFVWVPIIRDFNAPRVQSQGHIAWVPDQLLSSRDQVFAVRVHTDRLAPIAMYGDLMLADKERPPADGDVIVVRADDGKPDIWRLCLAGQAWWLCDAEGNRRNLLDRSRLQGVMLTIHRPRHAVKWAGGQRDDEG